jgi:hypothetical protein
MTSFVVCIRVCNVSNDPSISIFKIKQSKKKYWPWSQREFDPLKRCQPNPSETVLKSWTFLDMGTFHFTSPRKHYNQSSTGHMIGRDSSVGIGTLYGLDGQGIESWWRPEFLHPSGPAYTHCCTMGTAFLWWLKEVGAWSWPATLI